MRIKGYLMSFTHLWLDIVAGLKKEGWQTVGGNYTSFLIMHKEGRTIKVFLQDYKKLHKEDINCVIVRYS